MSQEYQQRIADMFQTFDGIGKVSAAELAELFQEEYAKRIEAGQDHDRVIANLGDEFAARYKQHFDEYHRISDWDLMDVKTGLDKWLKRGYEA